MSTVAILPLHLTFDEKYSWVDQQLSCNYYRYALTSDTIDEFMEAGLLGERWAWVDKLLTQLYSYPENDEPIDEIQDTYLLSQKWTHQRTENIKSQKNVSSGIKRKRSESDISDYDEEVYNVIKRIENECLFVDSINTGRFIDFDTMIRSHLSDLDSDISSNEGDWLDRDGANSEDAFGYNEY
jgi:hypothetical protein